MVKPNRNTKNYHNDSTFNNVGTKEMDDCQQINRRGLINLVSFNHQHEKDRSRTNCGKRRSARNKSI